MLTNRRRVVSPASHSFPHPPPSGHGFCPPSLPPRLLISSVHPLSSYHHDFPFSASRNTVKETRTGDLPRTYDAIRGMSSCLFRPFVHNFLPLPSLSSLFRPHILHPPVPFHSGENAWLTRGSIVSLTLLAAFSTARSLVPWLMANRLRLPGHRHHDPPEGHRRKVA